MVTILCTFFSTVKDMVMFQLTTFIHRVFCRHL